MTAATPAIGKVADPRATEDALRVGAALQRYLDGRGAGVQVLDCLSVSGGFETFIYAVTLGGAGNGHLPLGRPVILRIYHGPGMIEQSAWENTVIARVREDGIPAPAVYLYEPDAGPLGGPFLLLEFVHGRRMDEATLTAKPLLLLKLLRVVALVQTRIYRVAWPEGRRLAAQMAQDPTLGPFAWAGDRLGAARADIERRGLRQLLPIVDWLQEHRHLVESDPEVLIHGDFHPLNVFVEGTKVSGIIDWGAGGFANRHEDLGWSSLLIATATSAVKAEDKQLAPYRTVARQMYLRFLWKSGEVDRDQLRYGEVSAGLRWLMIFLPSYLPNAGEPLLNPDAIAFTTPLYVRRVRRFIEKRTRLTLGIV